MMALNGEITRSDSTKVLVISASKENRAALSEALSAKGFVPALCTSMAEARKFIEADDIRSLPFRADVGGISCSGAGMCESL